jgi:thioester reductase-like protein
MKILILGGTGFLGKYLVSELASIASKIYVVTRSKNNNYFSQFSNIELVEGDITDPEIIKDVELKKSILSECEIAIHAAALYEIKAEYEEIYLHNVLGTQNVLQLIKKASNLKAFYYVSTIAVADEQSDVLLETNLPERSIFNDNYSKTKYYAEKMVREFSSHHLELPVRIIRPGVIVGDSTTGKISNLNGPYYFINFLKKFAPIIKKLPILPLTFNPETHLHLIPVDHVAHYIFILISRDIREREIKTYHLICIDPPKISEFLKDISRVLEIKTYFRPMQNNLVFSSIIPLLNIPQEIIPFMFSRISYDKTHTLKDLPELKNSKYADFKKIFF